ncbi:O-Antigen ligase [Nocardioides dokdonensis FR1436]|uniref:O-Antigen ligase n=1 Tax=Nocardioides dokdonensis FR1436 TaxID=1300347 RepID=A0A1A9GRT2_9ACTN|nr:O-antigen ligase family protein [Nocardioides dokdonensis]ANH40151.1 O-Antigen ligase [Nocardioides dokdonensis FR1436]
MNVPVVTRTGSRAWGEVPRRAPRRTPPARSWAQRVGPRGRDAGLVLLLVPLGAALGFVLATAGLLAGPVAPVALVLAPLLVVLAWRGPGFVVPAAALSLPVGHLAAGPLDLVQLVTALLVVAVLVPTAARGDWRLPPWPVAVPLALMVVIAVLATGRARDTDLAFRLDVQLVLLVLATLAVVTAVRTSRQVLLAVGALLVAGAVGSLWAMLGSGPTESYYGGSVVTGRAVGVFAQPNELGLFSAVLLVLAVGTALSVGPVRWRRGALVSAALLLVALGLSLSRGAWFGSVAGLLALALLVPGTRRGLLRIGAGLVGAVLVLGALGVGPLGQVLSRLATLGEATSNPYDQRPLIWAEGLRLVAEAPVLGHGPGGYFVEASSNALRTGAVLEVEHAHHLLLNVAVEYGLIGLAALLGLVTGLGVLLLRARRAAAVPGSGPTSTWLPSVLAAALVPVLAHGMLDYPLRNPIVLTTVWFLLSLLTAACAVVLRRHPVQEDAR